MLTEASSSAPSASQRQSADPACSSAPMTMILLIALVTLISGVCSAGVTFQTTCQPTKQASTNTMKWRMKEGGATAPIASTAATPTARPAKIANPRARDDFFAGAGGSGSSAGAGAGAVTLGGSGSGGGHVTAPRCATVVARITRSFMSATSTPSRAGVNSAIRCRIFAAYNSLDCAAIRDGKSV